MKRVNDEVTRRDEPAEGAPGERARETKEADSQPSDSHDEADQRTPEEAGYGYGV